MSFQPPELFNIYDYFLGDRLREGRGDRIAVRVGGERYSYDDVAALAGRYAAWIEARGVRPEERVMVALPDGIDWVGAFFGVLRSGAVVVMVNPHLTAENIRYLYEYTGARMALVGPESMPTFVEAVEGAQRSPVLVDPTSPAEAAAIGGHPDDGPVYPSHRDDAAIWIFSGGTTGQPKAAVQGHRSFANTTELYGKGVLGLTEDDVTLAVPKLFFGYATGINLLFPFSVGATAALFPERCTTETLFAQIAEHRPTILVNVPTMVNHMVSAEGAAGRDLSSLRLATSAGEALPAEMHRRWDELFGAPLLDGLGTAEMWHIFVSNRPGDVRPGTLGRVVPGFDVEVRGEDGARMPPGDVGYLWVRGDSRAIGYWRQMDKTKAAFQGEWYVSGDMISMDEEGYVTYHGRGDDMLKVSGKWLSPRELENCLLTHPSVDEVVVVGATTDDGLIKPKAFVVPSADAQAGDTLVAALQSWAKERLEPYKYPREVVFLDDLPRTHLGKVDRGTLGRQ